MSQRKPDGEHTGGRRKSENRQRQIIVSTRLTPAEFAPLAAAAERTGKPVATILREMILASSGRRAVISVDDLTAADLARWFLFTTPDSPDCDGLDEEACPLEAVARAIWDSGCDHVAGESLLCIEHREELEAGMAAGKILACAFCRKLIRVVRIEPIR